MSLSVRLATLADLPAVMPVFDLARAYMRENGNMNQWTGGYPSEALIREDIEKEQFYLCTDGNGIAGVFCYFRGTEPTYGRIDGGAWLNDEPYGVIHRIGVTAHRRGVASFCFAWALTQCPNLRIDTHKDNIPMQNSLKKNGFSYCGIIYLESGDERVAYQKVSE